MELNAHVLAIPFPLQGHLNPMFQLCTRLISRGIRVTLLATSLVKVPAEGIVNQINIDSIPDVQFNADEDSDPIEMFFKRFEASIRESFQGIIYKYKNTGLKAVIYDSVCRWILDLVRDEGIRGAVLFTQPCAVSSVYYHVFNGSLETPINCGVPVRLPAMSDLLVKDLPSFVYDTSSFLILTKSLISQFSNFEKADWRLFNTFDELEHETIEWLSGKGRIHAIGPTVPSLYTDERVKGNNEYGLSLSLLKPYDDSCIKWLDQKPDNSVIYVSFGSLSQLSEKLIEEVSHGLMTSGVTFICLSRLDDQKSGRCSFKFAIFDGANPVVFSCSKAWFCRWV